MHIKVSLFLYILDICFILLDWVPYFLDHVRCVVISSGNKYIISGSGDKSIKVFDLANQEEVYHFENAHESKTVIPLNYNSNFLDTVNSVAISTDNRYIISGSADKSIKIFDLESKTKLSHLKNAHNGSLFLDYFLKSLDQVLSVAVSSDNKYIVSGSLDRSIKIFETS